MAPKKSRAGGPVEGAVAAAALFGARSGLKAYKSRGGADAGTAFSSMPAPTAPTPEVPASALSGGARRKSTRAIRGGEGGYAVGTAFASMPASVEAQVASAPMAGGARRRRMKGGEGEASVSLPEAGPLTAHAALPEVVMPPPAPTAEMGGGRKGRGRPRASRSMRGGEGEVAQPAAGAASMAEAIPPPSEMGGGRKGRGRPSRRMRGGEDDEEADGENGFFDDVLKGGARASDKAYRESFLELSKLLDSLKKKTAAKKKPAAK